VQTIIPIVLIIGFLYLLLIRPQRQNQRRHQALLENLKPGDEVITAGGIYGDIVAVDDEKVHVLIAEDVEIEVARRSIASVIPPEEPELEEHEDSEPEALEQAAEDGAGETKSETELEEAGRARGAQPRHES
jgi:preprotein translocase subunit YajC